MPRPPIMDDVQLLYRWADEGYTQQEIAEKVNEYNLEKHGPNWPKMTRATVAKIMSRSSRPPKRLRYDKYIPWEVRKVHNNHNLIRMLRSVEKIELGIEIAEGEARRANNFKDALLENDTVIHYFEEGVGPHPIPRPDDVPKGSLTTPEGYVVRIEQKAQADTPEPLLQGE